VGEDETGGGTATMANSSCSSVLQSQINDVRSLEILHVSELSFHCFTLPETVVRRAVSSELKFSIQKHFRAEITTTTTRQGRVRSLVLAISKLPLQSSAPNEHSTAKRNGCHNHVAGTPPSMTQSWPVLEAEYPAQCILLCSFMRKVSSRSSPCLLLPRAGRWRCGARSVLSRSRLLRAVLGDSCGRSLGGSA